METDILLAVHAHASPALDRLFVLSHQMGKLWFLAPLVLAMAAWRRTRGEAGVARVWILAGLSALVVQEILKRLVARPRPELWPRLVAETSFSFPSGHALATAALYPLLAWDLTRTRSRSARIAAFSAAIGLGLFVGLGRLYLGVHWPSDVVGGFALGALEAVLAIRQARCYAAPRSS